MWKEANTNTACFFGSFFAPPMVILSCGNAMMFYCRVEGVLIPTQKIGK